VFLGRWQMLSEIREKLLFTTPDRSVTRPQFLQLFHAFLLQVKHASGMVYIAQGDQSGLIATYFARALKDALGISARSLIPKLLKKTDLLVALDVGTDSSHLFSLETLSKEKEIPLITFSLHPLFYEGDLNTYFNCKDEVLFRTALFSLLKEAIETWTYDPLPFPKELFAPPLFATPSSSQIGLRL